MLRLLPFAAVLAMSALPACAEDLMHAHGAYARFLAGAKSGAAFMQLENHSGTDDRLIAASSPIAGKVELHTNVRGDDGMVSMPEVPDGFPVPAYGDHVLARGGDHLMFLDLTETPPDGGTVAVTLVFEHAGEVTVDIPVDNKRKDGEADDGMMDMDHGSMSSGG